MTAIFREPLLHFLLLGSTIFVLFQQLTLDAAPGDAEIVVSTGQIDALTSGFERVWQRAPESVELQALIESFIREEVMYREALALGLDKNDGIIRRRLSQKIQFLTENIADLDQADDATLQAYLDNHVDRYRRPAGFSFRQVYFNASKRGTAAKGYAESVLQELYNGDVAGRDAGDPIMIDYQFDRASAVEVGRVLGADFASALGETPGGSWQGPVESAFGVHLVFIDEHIPSSAADLNDVRDQVARDWAADRRAEANQAIYETARERYHIVIQE